MKSLRFSSAASEQDGDANESLYQVFLFKTTLKWFSFCRNFKETNLTRFWWFSRFFSNSFQYFRPKTRLDWGDRRLTVEEPTLASSQTSKWLLFQAFLWSLPAYFTLTTLQNACQFLLLFLQFLQPEIIGVILLRTAQLAVTLRSIWTLKLFARAGPDSKQSKRHGLFH